MVEYNRALPELIVSYKSGSIKKVRVERSQDAYEMLKAMYDANTLEYTECFIVILLNRANKTIGWKMISQGGISGTVIDVRTIFALALITGASNIILSHNHPSGNEQPSKQDIEITLKCKEVGKLHEIDILDHMIITNEGYYSMADEGIL